ncbi:hypothetical protein JTE90_014827 [Oedothorax gibbosus]|uniref:THAP-type domain-containing protein n=1 Tax=Oedothorax gibbosus TaxID=931172 RepID=A0AAV6UEN2_9ARAC|nr:hypothetical protein JTE90_014827 [Oedothorax gibbosus]
MKHYLRNIYCHCCVSKLCAIINFPKDPERRKEWESKVKKPNFKATDNSKICSKHFTPDCFEQGKFGGTWLTADAVPTIFEWEQPKSAKLPTLAVVPKSSAKVLAVAVVPRGSARVAVMPQRSATVLAVSVVPQGNNKMPAVEVLPQSNAKMLAMTVVPKSSAKVPAATVVSESSENKLPQKRKNSDVESSAPNISPTTFENKKRLCYFGDFNENTVIDPENARKFFHLAKSEVVSKNKEIRSLRKEQKRLKKRVAKLIKMLYEFRERHIIAGDVSSI